MEKTRDWQHFRKMWIRILEESTGESLDAWNRRIESQQFRDEQSLRAWIADQGISGYAQTLLVMEHFGYPDYFVSSADQLIDSQYTDRPQLRPILDAIIASALEFGEITIQARKTYVSLITSHRTFARVIPATKDRLDLGLRLEGQKPGVRLLPSKINETMKIQISLSSVEEVDLEVIDWLRKAYDQNR